MNTRNTTYRTPEPWIPTIPGPFVSPPKLVEVATSVFWRLVELNCATVSRSMAHNLSALKALADVRDMPGFVAQQQKSMQTLWNDQEAAMKAASDVIRTGFEALLQSEDGSAAAAPKAEAGRPSQQSEDGSAAAAPKAEAGTPSKVAVVETAPTKITAVPKAPGTTTVTDTNPARPTQASFEIYIDKAGEYRFRLKAADGRVLLKSEGYQSRSGAVNGVASVKKNAKIDTRYQKQAGAKGKSVFNLKAGNHQVIGSSRAFASADQMEAAITLIKQTVASSKVEDQTQAV